MYLVSFIVEEMLEIKESVTLSLIEATFFFFSQGPDRKVSFLIPDDVTCCTAASTSQDLAVFPQIQISTREGLR